MEARTEGPLELWATGDRATAGAIGFVALLWCAGLLLWCLLSRAMLSPCVLALPIIHLGAGLWLGYRALATWLNRARILLDDRGLLYAREPLPPHHRVHVPLEEIAEIAAIEEERRLLVLGFAAFDRVPWGVEVRLRDRSSVPLRLGLAHAHAVRAADRLEQKLHELRTPLTYRGPS